MHPAHTREQNTGGQLLRNILSLIMLALWLSPAELGAEPPLAKVTVQLDWFPQAEHGGYYDALIHHLYEKAGLDVQLLPASPGGNGAARVAMGGIDMALSTSDAVILARNQGLPLVSIMATMQHDPKALLLHADSPIKDLPDLSGHSIAVVPGVTWLLYITKKFDLKNVQEVRMTFGVTAFVHDPNYIQECFVTSEPYFAEQQGAKVRTLLIHQSGWDPYRVICTSDRFLSVHRDLAQKFVDCSVQGWKEYLTHPADTDAELLRRNPQMTQGQIDFSRKALIEGNFVSGFAEQGDAVGRLDGARMDALYKIQRDLKLITTDFDYAKSYDLAFTNPKRP